MLFILLNHENEENNYLPVINLQPEKTSQRPEQSNQSAQEYSSFLITTTFLKTNG